MKPAQHFYRKNGFHRILKEELPKDFPLVKVDNIFYYKDIYDVKLKYNNVISQKIF
ncbi:hypothetical protein [Macrococcus armenti]|uniref:hypothetical protein n=1 Tax=Macrococcus armenti TaxID=2875764 RepID=UPI001CD71578|nr:hypothetical protein [Macrococcus armenti]UBH10929.1 hypothetical protein LAU38_00155 [Macrococcus armenti]